MSYTPPPRSRKLPSRALRVVAFTAAPQVYALAELVRRQRGGAAVVLGALSPRTRNAQVALYQAGEVDYLIATDAIGMGLNMDVEPCRLRRAGQVRRPSSTEGLERERVGPDRRARRTLYARTAAFGITRRDRPVRYRTPIAAIENHRLQAALKPG